MPNLPETLTRLRRPRLLIRAARLGQGEYNRKRDLRRVLRQSALPAPGSALASLASEEAQLEAARVEGAADYSIGRHIEVLIVLLAELGLCRPSAT
ncbi:DUF6477 family protein [Thioclava sp. A2]|uniref:DUF6477 family protein n=1 Tax=Thioclava sp. FCG-A2 TaxID=3080562 RepID=UPI0029550473|nr:DUF6477 family protein [Thioclava sp. A2]MDV7269649.1 DUF6477 family protein [Thioclava sp. A2]